MNTNQQTQVPPSPHQGGGPRPSRSVRSAGAFVIAAAVLIAGAGMQVLSNAAPGPPADSPPSGERPVAKAPPRPADNRNGESDRNETPRVAWRTHADQAFAEAKRTGRPVLLDFTASWCAPCQIMDKYTWTDRDVQKALAPVIPVKIDMDSKAAAELVERFRVEFVPTVLLVESNGEAVFRTGFVDAQELLALLQKHQPAPPREAGS